MIEFRLEPSSGVAAYLQIVQQVRQALLLGMLSEGDRLPTVKQVVGMVAINPNTVLKAYRELEMAGLVVAKPGAGTFVTKSLAQPTVTEHEPLRRELEAWLAKARAAGLTEAELDALMRTTVRDTADEEK